MINEDNNLENISPNCVICTYYRGVSGGWASAQPVFGRIKGATLLLAHPVLGSHLRPCTNVYLCDLEPLE